MGWYGNFTLTYEGNNAEDFLKLSKMMIPNSIVRFDFDDCERSLGSVALFCTRNLSWYSADEDMKRIMSYLPDGDKIIMEIDGEDGNYENIEITKVDGSVDFLNRNTNINRYRDDDPAIPLMLFESHSPRYRHSDCDDIDISSIDGYVKLVANTFAGDEKLLPIVQSFMHDVLDKINTFARHGHKRLSFEDCGKLDYLRQRFETVDSTREFLTEHSKEAILFESAKVQTIENLPEWAQEYPPDVIRALGGVSLINDLIAARGEESAKEIMSILCGGIMRENEEHDE